MSDATPGDEPDAPTSSDSCAHPGALDPTFGVNGFTKPIFGIAHFRAAASSVVLEPNSSKILIGGEVRRRDGDYHWDCAVARVLADGGLDSTFGEGGAALRGLPAHECWISDVAVQSDGKIVGAGGLNNAAGGTLSLVRFDANGLADPDFGAAGLVHGPPPLHGSGEAVALDDAGRIVVAAQTGDGPEPEDPTYYTTLRYLPDGTPDPSFGAGGIAAPAFAYGWDIAMDVAIQPDGKIVVIGWSAGPGKPLATFGLVRYLPDGTRDPDFGADGLVEVGLPDHGSDGLGVVIDASGRALAAGSGGTGALLARLTDDGTLDASFGATSTPLEIPGLVRVASAPRAMKIAISPVDGKLVTVGWQSLPGSSGSQVVVMRFDPDGAADATFGVNGVATGRSSGPSASGHHHAADLAIQADGSIVVAGTRGDDLGDEIAMDFFAARFCP